MKAMKINLQFEIDDKDAMDVLGHIGVILRQREKPKTSPPQVPTPSDAEAKQAIDKFMQGAQTSTPPAPATPPPAAPTPQAPATPPPATSQTPPQLPNITQDQVKAKLSELINAGKSEIAKGIIQRVGATRLQDVDPKNYILVMQAAHEALQ